MNIRLPHLSCFALLPLFAACATVPTPLQGDYAPVAPSSVADTGRSGDSVRWGGIVIEVEPEADRTCIQVLARPLTDTARPSLRDRDASDGRFLACRAGFYDPEVFTQGREVTVTGQVADLVTRTIGEYPYTMPEVAADVIYLWPPRLDHDRVHVGFGYYDPFYGPWPYHRGWRGGFYYHHPINRPAPKPRPEPAPRPGSNRGE